MRRFLISSLNILKYIKNKSIGKKIFGGFFRFKSADKAEDSGCSDSAANDSEKAAATEPLAAETPKETIAKPEADKARESKSRRSFCGFIAGIFRWTGKWFRRAFWVAVAFVCVGTAYHLFFLDEIVRWGINNSANYIDLNAKVEDVDIHLLTQRLVLKNISLKNPDGFPENDAFSAAKLILKFDMFDLKRPLRRVYLQKAKIRVEGRRGKRIMLRSAFRSNVYVIARELGRVFGVKLEKLIFGNSDDSRVSDENSAVKPPLDYREPCR